MNLSPETFPSSILVVDDETPVLEGIVRVLESQGYRVSGVTGGEEAIDLFQRNSYDLVITDLRLEGMGGLEVLKRVKEIDEEIPVLIMTGFGTMESAIEAVRLGASDYLTKPVRAPELAMAVRNQVNALRLRRQVKDLNRQIAEERDKLREAVAELDLLKRLADRMMTALSYLEGYDLLINFLLEEMGSDLAAIFICENHQLRFNGKCAFGEKVQNQVYQIISHWLISLGKEDLIPSSPDQLFSTAEGITPQGGTSEAEGEFRSSISVPIVIDDIPFGLLIAASFSDSNFEMKWGRFAHQVARSASDFLTRVRRSVESHRHLTSAIVEHTGDGLVVVNFIENRTLLNPAAKAMLRIPVGVEPKIEMIQERLQVDLKSLWDDLHSHGEEPAKRRTIVRQVNIYDQDQTICLRMVASHIPETASEHGSMLLSLQDLTQEREVEEMKSRLVSNISHELRTPTSVVKEFIALLKDGVAGELTEPQKQILDIMKSNVERLGRLVENLLTLARAETGGFNVILRPEHLEPIIEQVVLSMTPKLQQKQIDLKVLLPP
ncbi:MAG: response regulator, partial [bacterium]